MNDGQRIGFDHLYDEPKLLLDDERTPVDVFGYTNEPVYNYPNWIIVRNYDEFVDHITSNQMPKIISWDHDLGGLDETVEPIEDPMEKQEIWDDYHTQNNRVKTGYDCMKWMVDYCFDNKIIFPRILIHTQNTVGYDNILYYYRNALRNKIIKLR